MKFRASGSLTTIRALFLNPADRAGAAGRFLRSPAAVRLCGVSFVLAGLAGISHSLMQSWWIFRTTAVSSAGDDRLYGAFMALLGFHTLLLSAGFLSLHLLLAKRYRWTWVLSAVGTLLAVLSGVGFFAGALYESLAEPSYYSSSGGLLGTLFFVGYFGQPAGVVLLGVAALWSRGLGRWRVLPFLAGLVGSPLSLIALWWLFPLGNTLVPGQDAREILVGALLSASPAALTGLGWISLGCVVFGVRKREAATLAKEQRTTQNTNLSLARRLYEEAWGAGDVAVLDDLAAPDFFDRRRDRRGSEGLKRAITDLRRTFPDLEFSVEEQRAEGDTVTTRCLFSGTDRGGLLWYPPTNRPADFTVTYTDRFSNGGLVEHGGGTDLDDLLQQLGLAPGPDKRPRQTRPTS